MPMSWQSQAKTKWWTENKLKIQVEAQSRARENIVNTLEKIYTPSELELSQIYKAVIHTIKAKAIANSQKIRTMPNGLVIVPPDINMNEQKLMWDIIKTERWEPTKITDREDLIPPWEWDDEEDVVFYLPDNWREWQKALE